MHVILVWGATRMHVALTYVLVALIIYVRPVARVMSGKNQAANIIRNSRTATGHIRVVVVRSMHRALVATGHAQLRPASNAAVFWERTRLVV